MADRARNENDMPDVPQADLDDALSETWSALSYAAYHLAYVHVYLETEALRTDLDQMRRQGQASRNAALTDVLICRAHLASFFWQLDHVFEALGIAIIHGKKERPTVKDFWSWGKRLDEIEAMTIRKAISGYRNMGHQFPAIIGCAWEGKGGKFLHHFLPTLAGHEPNETIEMNAQLQEFFEFVANEWLSFVPADRKDKYPRSFSFPVTIPNTYLGALPAELQRAPQLQVSIVAHARESEAVKE